MRLLLFWLLLLLLLLFLLFSKLPPSSCSAWSGRHQNQSRESLAEGFEGGGWKVFAFIPPHSVDQEGPRAMTGVAVGCPQANFAPHD